MSVTSLGLWGRRRQWSNLHTPLAWPTPGFMETLYLGGPPQKYLFPPPLIPHLRSVGKFYLNVQNMVLWDFCDKILLLVQMIIMLVLRQSNAISRLKKSWSGQQRPFFHPKTVSMTKGKTLASYGQVFSPNPVPHKYYPQKGPIFYGWPPLSSLSSSPMSLVSCDIFVIVIFHIFTSVSH